VVLILDVHGNFLEPSPESIGVDSAQPNIAAGPSQIGK